MKLIQFVGTRNKTDFIIYFSHLLSKLDKRVLIIDQTQNQLFRHGYTRLDENQYLFDFQGIDILCGQSSWTEVKDSLLQSEESINSYDVVIVDMDTVDSVNKLWPKFDDVFYVGDFDRIHQQQDKLLIRNLLKSTGSNELKRITFENNYKMDSAYFEHILGEDITWRSLDYLVESDDVSEELRIRMQHEQEITLNKLSRQYKEVLFEIVSALYELHIKDVENAVKPTFFNFRMKRREPKDALEMNEV